jgi:hypothetical protein
MREWIGEREVPGRAMGVIVGGDFSDPTNERIILLSAAGLVLIGVGLLIGTIVWWHRGRQEHPVLAPLEVMGGRAWARAPEADRRRRLEQVRLAGAGATDAELIHSDQVDLEALVRSVPQAFDDLREPGKIVVVPGEDIDQPEAVVPAEEPVEVVEVAIPNEPAAAEVVAAEVVGAAIDGGDAEPGPEPKPKPKPRSKPKPKAATEPSEVVDVDATTFSTERPPGDVDPVTDPKPDPGADPLVNGKGAAPAKRAAKPRTTTSATAARSGTARKVAPADPPS